jgi:hypothetical protein
MLDNLLNSVRRGAGRVQRRGEEVAQTARLRLEVFQLTRELDGLYARLGRSYHGGADMGVLQGVREDIRRVDEEISVRERLMEELARNPDGAQDRPDATGNAAAEVPRMAYRVGPAATPVDVSASSEPTIPDATPRPDQAPPPKSPTSLLPPHSAATRHSCSALRPVDRRPTPTRRKSSTNMSWKRPAAPANILIHPTTETETDSTGTTTVQSEQSEPGKTVAGKGVINSALSRVENGLDGNRLTSTEHCLQGTGSRVPPVSVCWVSVCWPSWEEAHPAHPRRC